MQEHRTLYPEEILYLIVVDRFKRTTAKPFLRIEEVDELLKPHACNEKFILDAGYVGNATNARKQPMKGTVVVTEEGRAALRQYLRATIAKAELDLKKDAGDKRVAPETMEVRQKLVDLLKSHTKHYPPLVEGEEIEAPAKPAPVDRDRGPVPDKGFETEFEEPEQAPEPEPQKPPARAPSRGPLKPAPLKVGSKPPPRRRR